MGIRPYDARTQVVEQGVLRGPLGDSPVSECWGRGCEEGTAKTMAGSSGGFQPEIVWPGEEKVGRLPFPYLWPPEKQVGI